METNLLYNESELLQRTATGDDAAFTTIFNFYWDNIYSVAFILTKSENMAEDVVQEVFLKVWHNRHELATVTRFDSYLFILARNHIFSEFRKLKVREEYITRLQGYFEAHSLSPEDELLRKETGALIAKAIAGLSPQQHEIYKLSREQGLTYEEIADKMGISANTVRNHMVRATRHIREYLSDHKVDLVVLTALLETFL